MACKQNSEEKCKWEEFQVWLDAPVDHCQLCFQSDHWEERARNAPSMTEITESMGATKIHCHMCNNELLVKDACQGETVSEIYLAPQTQT